MRASRWPLLVGSAFLSACTLNSPSPREDLAREASPNLALPAQWAARGGGAGAVADDWLAAWGDPSLEALVKEALVHNVDLRLASARVDVAAGHLAAAGASLQPQLSAVARGGGRMGGDATSLQGLGLFANWELDLWGRARSAREGALLQFDSARLDAHYARQSVAALVVKSWVLAIEARIAKARAEAMLATAEHLASLERDRQRVGAGDEYGVSLAQASVESFRDTVRALDLSVEGSARSLETLVGRYPSASLAAPAALPRWPGDLPAGLPSDLLERRPDLVAAERRVAAAFFRTEEAKAARLPRFSLIASGSSVSSDLFVLQDRPNPVFSVGASLIQPLFLGGLLQSQVDIRTAEQRAAVVEYGKVSARAFAEAENALSAVFAATEREAILRQSLDRNIRALELAQARHRIGAGDLRAVLRQQQSVHSAQLSLLRVQAERLVQRVNVHLALGGGVDRRDAASGGSVPPAP